MAIIADSKVYPLDLSLLKCTSITTNLDYYTEKIKSSYYFDN
jgi:hypothetical protein